MKKLTAMILALALLLSIAATPVAHAASYATAVVKGGWLRLRAAASYDAETISAYYTGTSVTILGGSGSWFYVATPDGKTGYMNSGFLTVTGSITGGQLEENATAYVTSKNGLAVRLRTGPSVSYGVIASYAVGTKATVLVTGEDWCKVRINGRTGYMMSEFLTSEPVSGSTGSAVSYTAYVTSKNGLGVRLRSGAGKLYPTLATYSVGTQVTVLEYGKTWSKIRVGANTGYMMTEFLTTTKPAVSVTAVKVSAASAKPGDVLYAQVTPAEAMVTLEWLNDLGVRVGTGGSYTVQASDAGRKIRVKGTGVNGTTGSDVSGWVIVSAAATTGYVLTGVTLSDSTPVVGQTLTATVHPQGASASIVWYDNDGSYLGSGNSYTVKATDKGSRLYAYAQGTGTSTGRATSSYTQAVTAASTGSVGSSTGSTDAGSANLRIMTVTLSDLTPTVGQTLYVSVSPAGATAAYTWLRDDDKILSTTNYYTVQPDDAGHTLYVWAEGSGLTTGGGTSPITSPVTGAMISTTSDLGW